MFLKILYFGMDHLIESKIQENSVDMLSRLRQWNAGETIRSIDAIFILYFIIDFIYVNLIIDPETIMLVGEL